MFAVAFVFVFVFVFTSVALATLTNQAPHAGRTLEVVALVAANGLATVIRFVAFRAWVFARPATQSARELEPAG